MALREPLLQDHFLVVKKDGCHIVIRVITFFFSLFFYLRFFVFFLFFEKCNYPLDAL